MRGDSRPNRGQSTVIGLTILLAIGLAAAVAVVAIGGTALTDTQGTANVEQIRQGMTQFDSRAAEVALGIADVQSVDFSRIEGTMTVRDSAGTITVTHANFDGSNSDGNVIDDGNNDDEEVYSGPLGELAYRTGDTVVAYQGGGVWLLPRDGEARMVSPPEFHYRLGTLTLPVIHATGSGTGSGQVSTTIEHASGPTTAFPDESTDYDGTSDPYDNPVAQGRVFVTVQSDYYQAWANYFRERTDGTVTEFDGNETVRVALGTLGATGAFPMPNDQSSGGGSVTVRGLTDAHSLQSFDFSIVGKDDQNSRFKNLRWSMFVEEGNQHFEIALGGSGNVGCGEDVFPVIYYSPDGGSTYQSWVAQDGYEVTCSNTDGDAQTEAKLSLDFIGSPKTFEYQSISGSELTHFKNEVGSATFDDGASEDLHVDGAHSALTVGSGDTRESDWLMKHYFSQLAPEFDLRVEDQQGGNGAGVDESDPGSNGFIDYPAGPNVVTYLHVTENEIEIRLTA